MAETAAKPAGPSDIIIAGITIRPADLAIVRAVLRAALPKGVKIAVFGSRAKGTRKPAADLDLAVDAGRRLSLKEQIALSDAFEDSDLPYKVDIADMHSVSVRFKAEIESHNIPLSL